MTYTNRLKLPLIHSGQAQKEITHNEALNMLDVLVNPIAHEINITSPPDSPKPGKLYVRVIEEITGTGSFGVGVAEDTKRYSNALAITKDTTNIGLTNHPLTLARYFNQVNRALLHGSNFRCHSS
ncbi:DUF2793 domain-containing protein [Rickettsia endosymbiont of Orchestes rusci]|uniref:DUF2793 domain-containing protein n=1 Tax=Rickettsia endosymbiont of Orchestes rusci TaxID=3066250 RepID=UPI00313C7E65